ncbi:MAG: HIRAN domain-containing protein [Pseudomonadota bacterium]|nr:HIRAN domain-containing protein [Pseudomonadota bacterium]
MPQLPTYPLELLDQRSGHTYQLWPWQDNLQVKTKEFAHFYKEANYPQTFFDQTGKLTTDLQSVLPIHFQHWANTIPLSYRKAVGILADNQTQMPQLLILRLMKQHRLFKDWILQLAQSQDGAYLKLMLTLANLENSPLPVWEHWLLSLPGQPRHTLLSRMINIELTAAQTKKTRKLMLDSLDWKINDIQEFLYYTQDSSFQKLLLSAHVIRVGALPYLRTLPRWLWLGKLWQMLSHFKDSAIANVLPPLILEADSKQQLRIIKVFKTLQSPQDLEAKLIKLVEKLAQQQAFPRPPFKGNNRLYPIETAKALISEGHNMQHCVGGYINSVVRGDSYFYHWVGDPILPTELTLQLKPFPKSSQWQLYEALGYQNQTVSESDWDYLRQQIANLNPPWGYLLVKSKIAGTDYSDYIQYFDQLKREMPLQLCAEPENPYDAHAIRIQTQDDIKLGYLPREHQATLQPYLKSSQQRSPQQRSPQQTQPQLACRLNYLKPHYATVNIYLTPSKIQ